MGLAVEAAAFADEGGQNADAELGGVDRGVADGEVEIDRALYMDETRIVPTSGFEAFRAVMAGVVGELAQIGRTSLPLAAE